MTSRTPHWRRPPLPMPTSPHTSSSSLLPWVMGHLHADCCLLSVHGLDNFAAMFANICSLRHRSAGFRVLHRAYLMFYLHPDCIIKTHTNNTRPCVASAHMDSLQTVFSSVQTRISPVCSGPLYCTYFPCSECKLVQSHRATTPLCSLSSIHPQGTWSRARLAATLLIQIIQIGGNTPARTA